MQRLSRQYVSAVDDLPLLVMSEFDGQPGLRLTFAQVQRLWALSARDCQDVLAYLVGARMLRTGDGQFYRSEFTT